MGANSASVALGLHPSYKWLCYYLHDHSVTRRVLAHTSSGGVRIKQLFFKDASAPFKA